MRPLRAADFMLLATVTLWALNFTVRRSGSPTPSRWSARSWSHLLWFGAIGRVGPSHVAVFANLQPFLAAIFSLLILSESMTRLQVAGGLAIAAGIVLSRSKAPAPASAGEAGAAGTVRK